MTMPGRTDDAGMNGNELAVGDSSLRGEPRAVADTHVEHAADALDDLGDRAHVGAAGLESPAVEPRRAGRTLSPMRSSASRPSSSYPNSEIRWNGLLPRRSPQSTTESRRRGEPDAALVWPCAA